MTEKLSCEEIRDLIPAYVIGALDPTTQQQVQAMLEECPDLQPEIRDYKALSDELLLATPPAKAPAHLLENILSRAVIPQAPKSSRNPFRWRWSYTFSGALLVLLMASNIYWVNRTQSLDDQVQSLNSELAIVEITPLPTEIIASPNLNTYQQVPVGIAMNNAITNQSQINNYTSMGYTNQLITQQGTSQASLTWSEGAVSNTWIGVLQVQNLPTQNPQDVYQLWLHRQSETPLNVGAFDVDFQGNALFVFEIGEPIETYDEFRITDETTPNNLQPVGETVFQSAIQDWIVLPR